MDTDEKMYVSFGRWAHDIFAPAILSYSNIIIERIAPMFDDVDGEADRAAQEVLGWSCWGEDDYERAVETAYEHALEKARQFMELRSAFLATGVSGLFHLFEKQVLRHLNNELRDWLDKPISQWQDATIILEKLRKLNEDGQESNLHEFINDINIKELRLVANAVKHGEGPSLNKLREIGAVVVRDEIIKEDCNVGAGTILGVYLSITPEDIIRYRDSIIKFWRINGTFYAFRSDFP